MTKPSSTINLGLSQIPEVTDDKYFYQFNKVYNAINLLASYLDQYTAKGTVVSSTTTGLIAGASSRFTATSGGTSTLNFTADEVTVKESITGKGIKLTAINSSINLASVGLGGMDIGAAPVNGYIAVYAIYNPVTSSTGFIATDCSSINAPTIYAGSAMPTGYTYSALLTVWGTTASNVLRLGFQVGKVVSFPAIAVSSVPASASVIALNITNAVPKNAINCTGYGSANSTTAGATVTLNLYGDSSSSGKNIISGLAAAVPIYGNVSVPIIPSSSSIYYNTASTAGTPSYTLNLTSYTLG